MFLVKRRIKRLWCVFMCFSCLDERKNV